MAAEAPAIADEKCRIVESSGETRNETVTKTAHCSDITAYSLCRVNETMQDCEHSLPDYGVLEQQSTIGRTHSPHIPQQHFPQSQSTRNSHFKSRTKLHNSILFNLLSGHENMPTACRRSQLYMFALECRKKTHANYLMGLRIKTSDSFNSVPLRQKNDQLTDDGLRETFQGTACKRKKLSGQLSFLGKKGRKNLTFTAFGRKSTDKKWPHNDLHTAQSNRRSRDSCFSSDNFRGKSSLSCPQLRKSSTDNYIIDEPLDLSTARYKRKQPSMGIRFTSPKHQQINSTRADRKTRSAKQGNGSQFWVPQTFLGEKPHELPPDIETTVHAVDESSHVSKTPTEGPLKSTFPDFQLLHPDIPNLLSTPIGLALALSAVAVLNTHLNLRNPINDSRPLCAMRLLKFLIDQMSLASADREGLDNPHCPHVYGGGGLRNEYVFPVIADLSLDNKPKTRRSQRFCQPLDNNDGEHKKNAVTATEWLTTPVTKFRSVSPDTNESTSDFCEFYIPKPFLYSAQESSDVSNGMMSHLNNLSDGLKFNQNLRNRNTSEYEVLFSSNLLWGISDCNAQDFIRTSRSRLNSWIVEMTQIVKCPEGALAVCLRQFQLSVNKTGQSIVSYNSGRSFIHCFTSLVHQFVNVPIKTRVTWLNSTWHQVLIILAQEDELSGKFSAQKCTVSCLPEVINTEISGGHENQNLDVYLKETYHQLEKLNSLLRRTCFDIPSLLFVRFYLIVQSNFVGGTTDESWVRSKNTLLQYILHSDRYSKSSGTSKGQDKLSISLDCILSTLQSLRKEAIRQLFCNRLCEPIENLIERLVLN